MRGSTPAVQCSINQGPLTLRKTNLPENCFGVSDLSALATPACAKVDLTEAHNADPSYSSG
jgi:hypothetical protein